MKKMVYVIISLLILNYILPIKANDNFYLLGHTIIIDIGHGGVDPGTVVGNVYEKDINLQIALKLKKEIENNGGSVILIRDGDYDIATPGSKYRKKSDFDNRIKMINNSKADLYLSIHMNYLNNPKYYGAQVFYDKKNEKLANTIQNIINKNLKSGRKIKKIPESTYMYSKLNIRGVLIECGFLSNKDEREKLVTEIYQEEFAKVIVKGLVDYFIN